MIGLSYRSSIHEAVSFGNFVGMFDAGFVCVDEEVVSVDFDAQRPGDQVQDNQSGEPSLDPALTLPHSSEENYT